jgi:CheY-like chemotaxis protein
MQTPKDDPMKQASVIREDIPRLSGASKPGDSTSAPAAASSQVNGEQEANFRKFQRFSKGMHTLIVEDNYIDQKIALGAAAQLGMRTTVVDSGMAAIEQLKTADAEDPFDLVLLDYKLPNLDGLTACKHIKKEVKLEHAPHILLLSAYHKDEIFHVRTDKNFVDGFITKPVSPHFLGSIIVELHQAAKAKDQQWPNHRRNDDDLLARCHVLLAEDNNINQRVAIGMLSRKGIKVTIAQNGQEAIDKVLSHSPFTYDVVLMDMDMPLVDGYDATRRIKSTRGYDELPIVALTAHNSQRDRQRCLDAGMAEFLTKPIKPNFLYETLLTFLR